MFVSSVEHAMHLVGLDRIERFLTARRECRTGDALRAFVSEMANRKWRNARDMARDFPNVSFAALPSVTFHLTPCSLIIDCLIDFPTETVLIDTCESEGCKSGVQCKLAKETAE